MNSVKELAARFDKSNSGLGRPPVKGEDDRHLGGVARSVLLKNRDDTACSSKNADSQSLTLSKPLLGKLESVPSHLEMMPLSETSGDLGSSAGSYLPPTSNDPVSSLELPPPSQPARFLRNVKAVSDSSTLTATKFSLEDDELSKSSSAKGNKSKIAPTALDGLPTIKEPGDVGITTSAMETHGLDHTPLPAAKLFARNAAPLYLPELDELLERLPRFEFTHPRNTNTNMSQPFPPHTLLQGRRVKDLVHNSPPTPLWRNWNSIGSTLVNLALSIMGSSAISTFYSLSGLYNAVQIFALILNTIAGHASGKWRQLILGTIPNILALNFGGKLLESMAFLSALTVFCGGLLFWFHRLTSRWKPNAAPEGLLNRSPSYGTHAVPFVSLALTVLYLPLSTIAIHAITWSSDFWPVVNPYLELDGAEKPNVSPLGPSSVFRDPLDFCWTTTMRKDEINYAPAAVILGVLTLVFMTIWYPIRLAHTIKRALPNVEPYDSLGQRRSDHELEAEYQRLLERDKSSFNFLYSEYRRKWGSFKAYYLGIKLTSLCIVTLVSPDSCLSLSLAKNHISRDTLAIARQAVLVTAMTGFLILQSVAAPLIDPVSNASEWTSRVNFVLTSLLGLFVALNIPGQAFWNGWVLYLVYIITYGLTVYFIIVNWNWMHRVIKRSNRRIDFSIDIFSPRLDLSPSSKHLTQRIWQESLTILLLAAPQCKMSSSQKIVFAEGPEVTSEEPAPPYLLNFAGSPAERYIENLKILREVGPEVYNRPFTASPEDQRRTSELRDRIVRHLVGPDAFWCPIGLANEQSRAATFFGNAWCIPFPLTVVIRYDLGGAVASITSLYDLEEFVRQNESSAIEKRRDIRLALRSLDGTVVKWPYTHTELVGNRLRWVGGRQYHAHRNTDYYEAILNIEKNGILVWEDFNLASGFKVSLRYTRNLVLDGSFIGLNDALELTPQLARFLWLNKSVLDARIPGYSGCLHAYRDFSHREVVAKAMTLSYRFLTAVFSAPSSPEAVSRALADHEMDIRVRDLAVGYEAAFEAMDERMQYVAQGAIVAWWYIFWDDFWRRNRSTIAAITTHFSDFDPKYTTSIAYRPLSRPGLEAFLKQRGLWSSVPKWYGNWWWIHTGFINKIYFHLNWIAFAGSSKTIHVHLGNDASALDLLEIDKQSRAPSPRPTNGQQTDIPTGFTTSSGIKAGTNHSDSIMRTRRAYRWETLMRDNGGGQSLITKGVHTLHDHQWHFWHDEAKQSQEYWVSWRGRVAQWFGITPLGRLRWQVGGLGIDVILDKYSKEQARYVRLPNHDK